MLNFATSCTLLPVKCLLGCLIGFSGEKNLLNLGLKIWITQFNMKECEMLFFPRVKSWVNVGLSLQWSVILVHCLLLHGSNHFQVWSCTIPLHPTKWSSYTLKKTSTKNINSIYFLVPPKKTTQLWCDAHLFLSFFCWIKYNQQSVSEGMITKNILGYLKWNWSNDWSKLGHD